MSRFFTELGQVFAAWVSVPDRLTFVGGVALVLFGVYLRWRMGYYAMQAEEQIKEGWLTEQQARRRMLVLNVSGPVAMIIGMAACLVVLRN